MNILNITSALHSKINTAVDLQELLILTKSLEKLNTGLVKIVATYVDLLSIIPNNDGELVFVDDEDRLYFLAIYESAVTIFPIIQATENVAYAWGFNSSGQLGDNTVVSRISPVSVIGGFTDWISASAGRYHNVGVRANGTLWAWGVNSYGRLGDNTTASKSSPVSVVGGFTDWISASAGREHSLGVRANGTLWAWGNNGTTLPIGGLLGDNTVISRSSPVSVVGGFTDWISASAGRYHSLGVRANGTLWAWGHNGSGRLGDANTLNRSSPVSVVGGFTDWISAGGGGEFSLGVRANGTLWAWGANSLGRLGDNTTISRSSPVSVVGGFTDWISASAGGYHSIGVRANGTLWAWGFNSSGQLGDNTVISRSSPVSVVGGFTDWISASAGRYHSLGVRANGTLWAWGRNSYGRLGDNTTISRSSPVSVVGGFTDWISASAGGNHSIGVRVQKISAV